MADNILNGTSSQIAVAAVTGKNTSATGVGVEGSSDTGWGVHGHSVNGRGVVAISEGDYGLRAHSTKSAGLRSSSTEGRGVEGWSIKSEGVVGISTNGTGIWGQTEGAGNGVLGTSKTGPGVWGESDGPGVVGVSHNGIGVHGKGGRLAGFFEGDVEVTGDIRLTNADFAEDFDVSEGTEPGEVMVLTETGTLVPSAKAYDKKVVGVLSGAGNYKPGIILDTQSNNPNRKPVAMMGKVYCKVDAGTSPIETGDMLTTSDIPGYAMKAIDPFRAFGAVIGKALASLNEGKGLIPILVTLQ